MKEETFQKVYRATAKMSDEQLRMLNDIIVATLKDRRRFQAAELARQMHAGAQVRFTNIKPKYMVGATGTIQEIRRTTALVRLDSLYLFRGSRIITVPLTCLEIIESEE